MSAGRCPLLSAINAFIDESSKKLIKETAEMKILKTNLYGVLAITAMSLMLILFTSLLYAAGYKRVIEINTVDQLYLTVNNDLNADATIHLAPGTYVLSTTNNEGAPRPNAGALRLRPGMSLEGSEEHVDRNFDGVLDPPDPNDPDTFAVSGTETTIDGSGLALPMKVRMSCGNTSTSFSEPMIAINRNNSISSLYLFGGDNIAVGEPANPIDSVDSLSLKVTNTVLDSFMIPISFSNSGCGRSHARSELIFTNNVVRNGNFFGMAMFNFITGNEADDTANGPEMKATLTSNRFYNNPGTALTMRAGAIGTDGGLFTLEMRGNIFRNNGSNFLGIGGGGGREATTRPIGNRLHITSRGDSFGEPSGAPPVANVMLVGGRVPDPLHNELIAKFFNTEFVRDTPANRDVPEILIIGAEGGGDANHARVLIRQAIVKTTAGSPTFGTLTIQDETEMGSIPNTARLMGSREDFLQLNQGFHAPANKFFVIQ
jgi:hypothetical protein